MVKVRNLPRMDWLSKTSGSQSDKIARLLLEYRHTTTGLSSAELMFGRPLRSRLSLVKPSLNSKVENKQLQQNMLSIGIFQWEKKF